MKNRTFQRGLTLPEVIVATFMMVAIIAVAARYYHPTTQFFSKFLLRRQMATESRQCMETVTRLLRSGRPETVDIGSFSTTIARPNSQIKFTGARDTGYRIAWNDDYSVRLASGSVATDTWGDTRILAHHVAQITFETPLQDPSIVTISLSMEGYIGKQRYGLDLPVQKVRVGTTP